MVFFISFFGKDSISVAKTLSMIKYAGRANTKSRD